jgi:Arc/MetJ family transcription regulator
MRRTNIEISEELLDIVMNRYGIRTKTEAVDAALRHLAGRPLTTEEILDMRGARLVDRLPDDTQP